VNKASCSGEPSRRVLLVGPIAVAWVNPATMKYGGVERVAWRMAHLLAAVDFEVLPTGPSDSRFNLPGIARRRLWAEPSLLMPGRNPRIFAEDVASKDAGYAAHVARSAQEESPDIIFLLGPSPAVLKALVDQVPDLVPRVVVCLHNGPSDNNRVMELLRENPSLTVTCLSELQRRSFSDLADRIRVVLDGINVRSIAFSAAPASARAQSGSQRRSDVNSRPLLAQVDYYHPNKGMLLSLAMYFESGLHERFNLTLAGGMGWQLPRRDQARTVGERYLDALREYVHEHDLTDKVDLLGPLTGRATVELYRCADLSLSPTRMDHGPLWHEDVVQDPESYGQGRAVANAAGTPVLMSDRYDRSFAFEGSLPLRFSTFNEGVAQLQAWASSPELATMRQEFRRFSERRDDLASGFQDYLDLIDELASRTGRHVHEIAPGRVTDAVDHLARIEALAPFA
jgi:glycosyltransferase involved in cell wall biosynthesis